MNELTLAQKTQTLRSLRPNVTEADAFRLFETSGPLGMLRRGSRGPLARMALVYLPFRVFSAGIFNLVRGRQQHEERVVAIDSVSGTLDLYQFPEPPGDAETVAVRSANVPSKRLAPAELEARLADRLRRTIFRRGFYALREFRLELRPLPEEIFVPYWVGFRGRAEELHAAAHIEVLDAVRRSLEGAKVRRLIEQWLRDE